MADCESSLIGVKIEATSLFRYFLILVFFMPPDASSAPRISGLIFAAAKIFPDRRGEFSCRPLTGVWIQENLSVSHKGVFRGFHLQTGVNQQSKNVRVLRGAVLDLVLDIRPNSPTFLLLDQFRLTGDDKNEIHIPAGCAHGFLALEDETILQYLVDKPYDPPHEVSLAYDSIPEVVALLAAALPHQDITLSDKDREGITLAEFQRLHL